MVTVRNQTYNRTYRTLKGKQREQVHLCISVAERLWEKLRTKLDKMTSFSRGGVVSHCLYMHYGRMLKMRRIHCIPILSWDLLCRDAYQIGERADFKY